jgi:hypothetical protein
MESTERMTEVEKNVLINARRMGKNKISDYYLKKLIELCMDETDERDCGDK